MLTYKLARWRVVPKVIIFIFGRLSLTSFPSGCKWKFQNTSQYLVFSRTSLTYTDYNEVGHWFRMFLKKLVSVAYLLLAWNVFWSTPEVIQSVRSKQHVQRLNWCGIISMKVHEVLALYDCGVNIGDEKETEGLKEWRERWPRHDKSSMITDHEWPSEQLNRCIRLTLLSCCFVDAHLVRLPESRGWWTTDNEESRESQNIARAFRDRSVYKPKCGIVCNG